MTMLNCATVSEVLHLRPQGYAPATPVSVAPGFLQSTPAAKYRALAPYFVRQETDCSCSVASTTVILNAALAQRRRRPLTQSEVVASDTTGLWAKATAQDPDCTGVDLDGLALLVMRSFYAAGLKHVAVDVHHVFDDRQDVQETLRHQLMLSEAHAADHYLVVNFHQKALLGAGEDVGHISLVAAFDKTHDRVLVYDVDNRGFEPYWVDLRHLVEGMNTKDDETGEFRGYLVVRLNR